MNDNTHIISIEKANSGENLFFKILKKYYLICVLILLLAIFGLLSDNFFTVRNLTNIFVQNAFLIVATIGITFIMISGGADLSISYQMSLVDMSLCSFLAF